MAPRTFQEVTEVDEIPIVDNPDVPVVYCDGVADIEVHDPNVRITYYEIRKCCGETVRSPVMVMVRPLASCAAGADLLAMRLQEQRRKVRSEHH